jgi:hypothetical protein
LFSFVSCLVVCRYGFDIWRGERKRSERERKGRREEEYGT